MNGYTKLFGSILDSTIWRESKETRLVWVTMMAMADRDGLVDASMPGLADRAKVTLDECEAAVKIFLSPDKWSRSKEYDGRRIAESSGGWVLLNYDKYRNKMNPEEVKEKARLRQEKHRNKKALTKKRDVAELAMIGLSTTARKERASDAAADMEAREQANRNGAQ